MEYNKINVVDNFVVLLLYNLGIKNKSKSSASLCVYKEAMRKIIINSIKQ